MEILLIKDFINSILPSIVGIAGFKELGIENNIDFPNDGIIIEENQNNKNVIDITLGLVLMSNISAKATVEEILTILQYQLKQKDLLLGKLTIYIKGIK